MPPFFAFFLAALRAAFFLGGFRRAAFRAGRFTLGRLAAFFFFGFAAGLGAAAGRGAAGGGLGAGVDQMGAGSGGLTGGVSGMGSHIPGPPIPELSSSLANMVAVPPERTKGRSGY
ncbi:MAG TPA: hypothetical protein VF970_11845 [Gemmatimonadales bacterium]